MGDEVPYDARSIANHVLNIRDFIGLTTTQLDLQKIVFFCHSAYLHRTRGPLVKGYFEAWQHGPVHATIYRDFKVSGDKPISHRARKKDLVTGNSTDFPDITDTEVKRHLHEHVSALSALSTWQLVERSHAPRGPWAKTVYKGRTDVAFGLRIDDATILECHRFQGLHDLGLDGAGRYEVSRFATD